MMMRGLSGLPVIDLLAAEPLRQDPLDPDHRLPDRLQAGLQLPAHQAVVRLEIDQRQKDAAQLFHIL